MRFNCLPLIAALFFTLFCLAEAYPQCDIFNLARSGSGNDIHACLSANKALTDSLSPTGHSPLILAAYNGNKNAAAEILKFNPDVNFVSPDGTALMAAVVKGQMEIVKILLQAGADPNIADAGNITPLILASMFQNVELFRLLLQSGARKELADSRGNTALTYAQMHKNSELIILLSQ